MFFASLSDNSEPSRHLKAYITWKLCTNGWTHRHTHTPACNREPGADWVQMCRMYTLKVHIEIFMNVCVLSYTTHTNIAGTRTFYTHTYASFAQLATRKSLHLEKELLAWLCAFTLFLLTTKLHRTSSSVSTKKWIRLWHKEGLIKRSDRTSRLTRNIDLSTRVVSLAFACLRSDCCTSTYDIFNVISRQIEFI